MDDETIERRTVILWQATTFVLAGMGVTLLMQNWQFIRSWLR